MSKQNQRRKRAKKTKSKTLSKVTIVGLPMIGVLIGLATVVLSQRPAQATDIVVYKSPTCGCCKKWISHLGKNGYSVEVHNQYNVNPIKSKMGVSRKLHSCHTAVVDGYVIEGHVPAVDITRLLDEKPSVKGLAVPGMPMGSPGMEGPRKDSYEVLTFQENGRTTVFAEY